MARPDRVSAADVYEIAGVLLKTLVDARGTPSTDMGVGAVRDNERTPPDAVLALLDYGCTCAREKDCAVWAFVREDDVDEALRDPSSLDRLAAAVAPSFQAAVFAVCALYTPDAVIATRSGRMFTATDNTPHVGSYETCKYKMATELDVAYAGVTHPGVPGAMPMRNMRLVPVPHEILASDGIGYIEARVASLFTGNYWDDTRDQFESITSGHAHRAPEWSFAGSVSPHRHALSRMLGLELNDLTFHATLFICASIVNAIGRANPEGYTRAITAVMLTHDAAIRSFTLSSNVHGLSFGLYEMSSRGFIEARVHEVIGPMLTGHKRASSTDREQKRAC